MTKEESLAYKADHEITSLAEWDEASQRWCYDHIGEKERIAGDAQGLRVSREVMKRLYEMFPDKDDDHSNKPIYTHREMNRAIRAAIAQNYRKFIEVRK